MSKKPGAPSSISTTLLLRVVCASVCRGHVQAAASSLEMRRGRGRKRSSGRVCLLCVTWTDPPPPMWRKEKKRKPSSCPLTSYPPTTHVTFPSCRYNSAGSTRGVPKIVWLLSLSCFVYFRSLYFFFSSKLLAVTSFRWTQNPRGGFISGLFFSFNPGIAVVQYQTSDGDINRKLISVWSQRMCPHITHCGLVKCNSRLPTHIFKTE